MANKRMFTMHIIDSDAFLDMPLSAQCLYFHLNMRADDDGFLGNPKRIMRLIGSNSDDLKLLLAKRFILAFDDGVIVIKHWRMHNTIRADRYTPTTYQEELSMLLIKENKSYSLNEGNPIGISESSGNQMATECQPDVIPSGTTGIGLGIGLDIDKGKEEIKKEERANYQQIADLYNNTCVSFPKLRSLSEARKKAIKARLKTYTIDDFKVLFQTAEESDFLKGKNDRNWNATFDWLIKDSNMAKVLDGNYKNKGSQQQKSKSKGNSFTDGYQQRGYSPEYFAQLQAKQRAELNNRLGG